MAKSAVATSSLDIEAIDRLEQKLAAPVITSTQAILWHALRLAGIDDRIRGYGRLFDG